MPVGLNAVNTASSSQIVSLSPTGILAASAFAIGTAAADASDRIIYNPTSGALLYDADGTGARAAVLFATLDPGLMLTNTDFHIV